MTTFVADYLEARQKMSVEVFADNFPNSVLVFRVPETGMDDDELTVARLSKDSPLRSPEAMDEPMGGFGPQTSTMASLRSGDMLRKAAESMQVVPIRKTGVNLYQDKITVGRAANNDVILASSSVSKFHAYFRNSPDGALTLTDSGSKNGTFVDWVKLEPRRATPLRGGMEIIFGELPTRFYDPAGFHDFLSRFMSR